MKCYLPEFRGSEERTPSVRTVGSGKLRSQRSKAATLSSQFDVDWFEPCQRRAPVSLPILGVCWIPLFSPIAEPLQAALLRVDDRPSQTPLYYKFAQGSGLAESVFPVFGSSNGRIRFSGIWVSG